MSKKLSLAIVAVLIVLSQTSCVKALQKNYGLISSWNININTSLYNSGSIYGSNIDILGFTHNYKKGTISAKSSLRINGFRILVEESKNENASIVIKYPNGYINIFCKSEKINISDEFEKEEINDVTIYKLSSDFKIEVPNGSHLVVLDGVVNILGDKIDEPIQEDKPKNTSWHAKVLTKLLFYSVLLKDKLIWKKQEFVKIEDCKYEVFVPNKIMIDHLAESVNLVNEGSIFMCKIKLEIL